MVICDHLKPILNHELNRGNTVTRIDLKKWTSAEYVVKMLNELDTSYISANIMLPSVYHWKNNDTHYDFKNGYYCKECKHGIISP